MGFDNECIVNIQSLAGEYFCPVCRLLVYPNEALQSQCTHLYCKPCLTYVVGTTRACPYDGYLVTEADSKPLIESNKALAETIGKIEVHCLYHRSGCPWKGPLSDCTPHCSGCAFGNSPVVCNRCGIQIVHRQVQDHAQNCPGIQSQAQQTTSVQNSSATAASADLTQAATQAGTTTSQALVSQAITTTTHGQTQTQNQNQQASSVNHQGQAVAQVTSDQWYQQQQYQQFYQHYAGYDPYQQYYPYQQQAAQLYQQHGQAYPPSVTAQQTLQSSSQPQPQTQLQPQSQAQPQPASQSQLQPHSQIQPQPHALTNVQPTAASQQLQPHIAVPPHSQMQLHTHPPAQGHPPPQPQPYHQSQQLPQPHTMQSYPQQQQQMPQYQHGQPQMQHPQSQVQPQPQPQHMPLPQPQPHSQAQPLIQPQHPQALPQTLPPQQYQPNISNIQPTVQHLPTLTGHQSYPQLQSHQQMQLAPPQHPVHMNPQSGPQQLVQHSAQVQAQFPQQPMHTRPPQSQGLVPNQQPPALLPSTGQPQNVPSAQQQLVQSSQKPGHPGPHHPFMQSNQQLSMPQQFVPQQSPIIPQQQLPMPTNSQLRPQGLSLSQNQSHGYPQSQQTFALSHGMQPYQKGQVDRPNLSNVNVQPQSISKAHSGVAVAVQIRPMQVVADPNYAMRTNKQLPSLPEQQSANSQFEDNHLLAKGMSGQGVETPEQRVANDDTNTSAAASGRRVDLVGLDVMKSENDLKWKEDQAQSKDKTSLNGIFSGEYATSVDPELHVSGNGGPSINQAVKHEAVDSTLEHSAGGKLVETVSRDQQQDSDTVHDEVKRSLFEKETRKKTENLQVQNGNLQNDVEDNSAPNTISRSQIPATERLLPYTHIPQGSMHQPHYGSSIQQKPVTGPPHGQMPGHPHTQFKSPLNHPDTFPPPGGVPGPRPTSTLERGPGQGPANRSFEQSIAPPGLYNHGPPNVGGSSLGALPPGPFDSHGGMVARAAPPGPEGKTGQQRPAPLDTELFANQRRGYFDGRQMDQHPPRSGLWDDGFSKVTPEGHLNPFNMESGRRVANQGEFLEDLKRFPRPSHLDAEPIARYGNYFSSSRSDDRGPHDFGMDPLSRPIEKGRHEFNNDTGLRLHPKTAGERLLPGGLGEDNMGRPKFPHPDFLGPDPGYGRHPGLASRSPHTEYPGVIPCDIGSGGRSGRDIDSRDSRRFGEGSRPFNLRSDSNDISLRESRFANMPPHLRRSELESNMNMSMGDYIPPGPPHMLRSGELIGQDTLPSHLRRGEHFDPNSHVRLGEPASFGAFSGHARIGDMSRFGDFPPRRGEPGFRSSYSLQDSSFYMGEESFDNSRKRKPSSMGWCRICKVDCDTSEGLDMHSQTREHQQKSMDMVLKIKQQNVKKQKLNSNDRSSVDEPNKSRNGGFEGHANKR